MTGSDADPRPGGAELPPRSAAIHLPCNATAQLRRARDDLLAELNLLESDLAAEEGRWMEPTRRLYRNARADWSRAYLEMSRIIDTLDHTPPAAPDQQDHTPGPRH